MSGKKRPFGTGPGLQILRRAIQFTVLAMLFAIPSLSLYDNLRNQRDQIGIDARVDTRTIDALVGSMEHPQALTQLVRGSVWTLKVGDVVISDPLAVVDFVAASATVLTSFLLTALVPLLLTVLLGRFFCGWICPADLLFEAGSKLRDWARIGTDVTFLRGTKYAILIVGAIAGAVGGLQVFAEIYPPRIISGELYLSITFGAVGAGAWFLVLVLAFEIFVSRRFWCRYICPGGALYSLLGTFRVLRLSLDERACTSCTHCRPACEYGLDPMRGEFGPECNNCGHCVRACGPGALRWRVGLRPRGGKDILPGTGDRRLPVFEARPGAGER